VTVHVDVSASSENTQGVLAIIIGRRPGSPKSLALRDR
jgi:hypothetical protein